MTNRRKSFIFKVVRKGGFEPPRYCYRQPLKLVRLPVPPLPRGREDRVEPNPVDAGPPCSGRAIELIPNP